MALRPHRKDPNFDSENKRFKNAVQKGTLNQEGFGPHGKLKDKKDADSSK